MFRKGRRNGAQERVLGMRLAAGVICSRAGRAALPDHTAATRRHRSVCAKRQAGKDRSSGHQDHGNKNQESGFSSQRHSKTIPAWFRVCTSPAKGRVIGITPQAARFATRCPDAQSLLHAAPGARRRSAEDSFANGRWPVHKRQVPEIHRLTPRPQPEGQAHGDTSDAPAAVPAEAEAPVATRPVRDTPPRTACRRRTRLSGPAQADQPAALPDRRAHTSRNRYMLPRPAES